MLALFWEGLSPWHLLVIFAIALLFYGNRLPEVARSLGRAVNEFKRGLREVQDEVTKETSEPAKPPPQPLQPPAPTTQLQSPSPSQPQSQTAATQPQQPPPPDDLLG
jgi:TatA/E family protein of Tat protein translocase